MLIQIIAECEADLLKEQPLAQAVHSNVTALNDAEFDGFDLNRRVRERRRGFTHMLVVNGKVHHITNWWDWDLVERGECVKVDLVV